METYKLVTYQTPQGPRAGVVAGEEAVSRVAVSAVVSHVVADMGEGQSKTAEATAVAASVLPTLTVRVDRVAVADGSL